MSDQTETFSDQLLGFALPSRHVRGRMVRLDDVIDRILSAHDYPPPIALLLSEALVLTALMGGLLKDEGTQITMQARTEAGAISLLVCDYRQGDLRGMAEFDAAKLAESGANPTLFSLFGKGYLAVTFEPGSGQRYQGIVPLEGDTLAQACERYFSQSEQVPTLLRIGIRSNAAGGTIAAGLLIQHLPEGEEGGARLHVRPENPDWEHAAWLAASTSHDELTDRSLSLEAILWRLFHEEDEIHVLAGARLARGCRCSAEHYHKVIARFSPEEQEEMRNDEGRIVVDCAFCSRAFPLDI